MSEQTEQAIKRPQAANIPAAELPTWHQRCLGPVDRLDYAIRRWVIQLPPLVNRAVAATRGPNETAAPGDSSRSKVLLTEIQAAIARGLGAEYSTAQPIPARLADLLREFEQQAGQATAA